MKKKITCVIGTRPELIKVAPVVSALEKKSEFEVNVVLTAQHRGLVDQLSDFFDLPIVADLDIMTSDQDITHVSSEILKKMKTVFSTLEPDFVIVQGDTTTTLFTAIAAFYKKIPIGYVESGLRTKNLYRPFPEEMNRRLTAQIATLHFAPTEISLQNLLGEGIDRNSIFVTGNTVIDAIVKFDSSIHKSIKMDSSDKKQILVTCHRRENFGKPLDNIIAAIGDIASKFPDVNILFPVHPNPRVREYANKLKKYKNINLLEPLDYPQFLAEMKASVLILSDSGGVQEESAFLGKPLLIMRTETDRPESITHGSALLVGVKREDIVNAVEKVLLNTNTYKKLCRETDIYGDGSAATKIADIIYRWFYSSDTLSKL